MSRGDAPAFRVSVGPVALAWPLEFDRKCGAERLHEGLTDPVVSVVELWQ